MLQRWYIYQSSRLCVAFEKYFFLRDREGVSVFLPSAVGTATDLPNMSQKQEKQVIKKPQPNSTKSTEMREI